MKAKFHRHKFHEYMVVCSKKLKFEFIYCFRHKISPNVVGIAIVSLKKL